VPARETPNRFIEEPLPRVSAAPRYNPSARSLPATSSTKLPPPRIVRTFALVYAERIAGGRREDVAPPS
jgi:hypothetical protein